MDEETFRELDRLLEKQDERSALQLLIGRAREHRNPGLLFEALLMRARWELGLPVIQEVPSSEFPVDTRAPYHGAMLEAARAAGQLALETGDLATAWRYYRAIEEPEPLIQAIEKFQAGEQLDAVIEIALQEGLHPVKGLSLILEHYGMCRAITCFGMYPIRHGREQCIALLVTKLHQETVQRLRQAIASQEGQAEESDRIPELIAGRDWLFGEYDYYVDTSHLLSILPYSQEVAEEATLRLLGELCEYGRRLSPLFHHRGQPPFEEPFIAYGHYVNARLGKEVEQSLDYFRAKAEQAAPDDLQPAETLVQLLAQLGRYDEALEVALRYFRDASAAELNCPSPLRLCSLARRYEQMAELARERGDLLSYFAARLNARPPAATPQTVSVSL
jgi:tetratricopeptide (TPR) repeat protein